MKALKCIGEYNYFTVDKEYPVIMDFMINNTLFYLVLDDAGDEFSLGVLETEDGYNFEKLFEVVAE